MTPLESLDPFLAHLPEDRRLTRAVRRHLHGFGSLAVVGPAAAVEAVVLRLVATFPSADVNLVAFDAGAGRVSVGPPGALDGWPTDADAVQAIRSALRQDPDVIAVSLAPHEALPMVLTAIETGHQVVCGSAAVDLSGFDAALGSEALARFAHAVPAVLVLDASGKLSALLKRDGAAWAPMPDAAPAEAPRALAPIPDAAPPPARSAHARMSWVPRTSPGARTPHRIAASEVLLPPGGWPVCAGCGAPLRHVVQLLGDALPEPLARSPHVIQLFVCDRGCNLGDGSGISVAAHPPEGLVETIHPSPDAASLGGGVTGWLERPEDPHPDEGLTGASDAGFDDADPRPWHCDKLGGWPCWEQGPQWPEHDGARMELLFQLGDDGAFTPGAPARWDDEASVELPGTRREPRLDPSRPVHLPGVLCGGDGCGWLFRSAVDPTVLRFIWQTS